MERCAHGADIFVYLRLVEQQQNMLQILSARAHMASAALCLRFVSFEETVLVCAHCTRGQDPPELSGSYSHSGEMVFLRVYSPINSSLVTCLLQEQLR